MTPSEVLDSAFPPPGRYIRQDDGLYPHTANFAADADQWAASGKLLYLQRIANLVKAGLLPE